MDRIHSTQKELVQQITFTPRKCSRIIFVFIYDATNLYFEMDQKDDLRKTDFSKERKYQNPELLISKHSYPLAYEIFEGHTKLPVIDTFKNKYTLDQLVVIADIGLLSNTNVLFSYTKEDTS